MKKILVADDERVMRMLIAETLKIGNFQVIEADNGFDALKMAEREKPDLMILDVLMPGMTGYEVCNYIKSNTNLKQIRVLLLTGRSQQSDKGTARSHEADYYMSKPFSPVQLLDTALEILAS